MEFIVLDLTTATEDQIKATIECNNRTARLMRSEIDKLKRVADSAKKAQSSQLIQPLISVQPQLQPTVTVEDEDFENEVEYYLAQLKRLDSSNIEVEFEDVLPSRKHFQYERILNRLKLESLRTIKEIKEVLLEEGISLEEVTVFQEEYDLELKKLALLSQHLSPQKEEEQTEIAKENVLIFAPTIGGDIRVLDEIDAMPQEHYDKFYGLFQSIKDGSFKNVKRLSRKESSASLCEVKDYNARVIFARLTKDTYALISVFIKKSDTDRAYRATLSKRFADYETIEASLISNLTNPEFLSLQQGYEQELFNKLAGGTAKVSQHVKQKGGEA